MKTQCVHFCDTLTHWLTWSWKEEWNRRTRERTNIIWWVLWTLVTQWTTSKNLIWKLEPFSDLWYGVIIQEFQQNSDRKSSWLEAAMKYTIVELTPINEHLLFLRNHDFWSIFGVNWGFFAYGMILHNDCKTEWHLSTKCWVDSSSNSWVIVDFFLIWSKKKSPSIWISARAEWIFYILVHCVASAAVLVHSLAPAFSSNKYIRT